MKKIYSIALCFILIFSCFVGCTKTGSVKDRPNTGTEPATVSDEIVSSENQVEDTTEPYEVPTVGEISESDFIGEWNGSVNIAAALNEGLKSGELLGEAMDTTIETPLNFDLCFNFNADTTYTVSAKFDESNINEFSNELAIIISKYVCEQYNYSMEELDNYAKSQGYENGIDYVSKKMSNEMYESFVDGMEEKVQGNGTWKYVDDVLTIIPEDKNSIDFLVEFDGINMMILNPAEIDTENKTLAIMFPMFLQRAQ